MNAPEIRVMCANPETVVLRVTAEFPLAQWEKMLNAIESGTDRRYYGPLHEFVLTIRRAIQKARASITEPVENVTEWT